MSGDVAADAALAAGEVLLMCCTRSLYILRHVADAADAARVFKTFYKQNSELFLPNFPVTILRF